MYKGVCPDAKVGGSDNYQINTFVREDGLTKLTFRRNLANSGDNGDKEFKKEGKSSIVWAIGKLNSFKEPRMHHIYPKGKVMLEFGRQSGRNCYSFSKPLDKSFLSLLRSGKRKSWGPLRVFNQSLTTYYARIGVPGGLRGYPSLSGSHSSGLVWYINGLMGPTIFVKRGRTYTFRVEGGNNPQNARYYHPLYITDDPYGGLIKQTDEQRRKSHVYAGVEFDKKGRPNPISVGRLCLWSYSNKRDARKSDDFHTFIQFRNSLNYSCDNGKPGLLQWTPNASTPDIVYYQSYTQRNMGGKILVLDDFAVLPTFVSSSSTISASIISTLAMLSLLSAIHNHLLQFE